MKCVHCGVEFTGPGLFCSPGCAYLESRKKHRLERICRQCGKTFVTDNGQKICCSKICAARRYHERRKAKLKAKSPEAAGRGKSGARDEY